MNHSKVNDSDAGLLGGHLARRRRSRRSVEWNRIGGSQAGVIW
jgi:hypothetical protein